jgi:pyrimidine-nucleoside phosphorylase
MVDDPGRLPAAPHRDVVRAERAGFVQGVHAERVGKATVVLGAGRDRVEDSVDPAVGALVLVRPGNQVKAGDPLLELHYREASKLATAKALLQGACSIGEVPPPAAPLVLDTIE